VDFNLALLLTVLTAVSGAVVAFNYFYYGKRAAESQVEPSRVMATVIEYARSFFPVLLFVLIIRSFIFEPFRIPSGSMMPTLLTGDFIFVKKFSYGLRLPVLETKFLETGEPQRGDVVVFRLPSDPGINYIKRIIGLPGDEIVYHGQRLFVNGDLIANMPDSETPHNGNVPQYTEILGERKHDILLEKRSSNMGDGSYTVPEGHYFMMGDNRDHSRDSRFIGAVPETHLVGEAVLIWMHMDGLEWPDWGRIGTGIQ